MPSSVRTLDVISVLSPTHNWGLDAICLVFLGSSGIWLKILSRS